MSITNTKFDSLSLKQQYRAILNVNEIEDFQKLNPSLKYNRAKISNWVIQWFQANSSKWGNIQMLKKAIRIQKKLSPTIHEITVLKLLKTFSVSCSHKLHIDDEGCLTINERQYFMELINELKLTSVHMEVINKIIGSFSYMNLDFKVIETIILTIGSMKADDQSDLYRMLRLQDRLISVSYEKNYVNFLKLFPYDKLVIDALYFSSQTEKLINAAMIPLKAFPKEERKEIFLGAVLPLSRAVNDVKLVETILTRGLSLNSKLKKGSLQQLFGGDMIALPPLITIDQLKKQKYTESLVDFIARYLGGKKTATAVSVAAQWIRRSALQVFSDPMLFFREIVANALDSKLPPESQIGNFGMGFFSIFSLFYQTEHPIDRIELDTCYLENGEQLSYRMTFTKEREEIQIQWEMIDKANLGTKISVFSKFVRGFSQQFIDSLDKSFTHAFRFMNVGTLVDITLLPNEIGVEDSGRGIPLSKIHLLLIPSISEKRNRSATSKEVGVPSVRRLPTESKTSSFVFTINSVVNSVYPLSKVICDSSNKACDLVIELPKGFKPNLRRDGVVIPGNDSLEAKALCSMIKEQILLALSDIKQSSSNLSLLYYGLKEWEQAGLSANLKGFFSAYFQRELLKELTTHAEYIPCPTHPWIIEKTSLIWGEKSVNFIPLPSELILEGYSRYESALISFYRGRVSACSHPKERKEIMESALNGQMIEGLSVLFLEDGWLWDGKKTGDVTSVGLSRILFAPHSLLEEVGATFKDVQRKICQRFVGDGKRIRPYKCVEFSPLFASTIYIPNRFSNIRTLVRSFERWKLLLDYLEKQSTDFFEESLLFASLDKYRCEWLYRKYRHCLPLTLKHGIEDNIFPRCVSDEVYLKRLCVLLIMFLGFDYGPQGIPADLFYYKDGEKKAVDIDFLEEGIETFFLTLDDENVSPTSIYCSGTVGNYKTDFRQKTAPFAPLFANLKVFLDNTTVLTLVNNFHDLHLMQEETPSYCRTYFDQLFELYYQYLTIPSQDFNHEYGTETSLTIKIEKSFYQLNSAIELLKEIDQALAIKLLQALVGKFGSDFDLNSRQQQLKSEYLSLKLLTGCNILGLLTSSYDTSARSLVESLLGMASTHDEIAALAILVYYLKQETGFRFLKVSNQIQEELLRFILQNILRKSDLSVVNYWISGRDYLPENENDLPAVLRSGVDFIQIFLANHQSLAEVHKSNQHPEMLFEQSTVSIFCSSHYMETLFNHENISVIFAQDNVKGLLQALQQTPGTGRFKDYGMITHSSSHGQGFNEWQAPLIELYKNSLDALKNFPFQSSSQTVSINTALIPLDDEKLQLVYEVADQAGFENLESLMGMLIPGYHPSSANKMGLGFFRMLADVSVIHYQTRLQSKSDTVVSLIVQPVRDHRQEIVDLKVGLEQLECKDSFQGTVCRVYMQPQGKIEGLMRSVQVTHFVRDLVEDTQVNKTELEDAWVRFNGSLIKIHSSVTDIQTSLSGLSGLVSSKQKLPMLLIDGIPHSTTLDQFFIDENLFPPLHKAAGFVRKGFISFPKECFVSLQDPSKLVVKAEALPAVHKYILDWHYFHLFIDINKGYLQHFFSKVSDFEQLLSPSDTNMGTHHQILQKLENRFRWFFTNYSYTGEITVDGKVQKVTVPSVSHYLNEAYKDLFTAPREDSGIHQLDAWCHNKNKSFKKSVGKNSFSKCNEQILELVREWYSLKLKYRPREMLPKSNEMLAKKESLPIQNHPILSSQEPKWRQAQSLIEEVLSFYAVEVMFYNQVKTFSISVKLAALDGEVANYTHSKDTILISVNSHPFSQLLSLIESFEREKIDSHYIGGILYSENPAEAGTLNHEIYHAIKHAQGLYDEKHNHEGGVSFEVGARKVADRARQDNVMTSLENKIHMLLYKLSWTADDLQKLAKEAKAIEAKY